MKIEIHVQETIRTLITREAVEIDTDNYPELEGMDEDQIIEYINNNVWDMKPFNYNIYDSLGEELTDASVEDEGVVDEDIEFYVDPV